MKDILIDINCDVGEGLGNESELLPLISSCNIACGGHAGDKVLITKIIRLALKHGVKIGAHPSYPDKENFGRKSLDLPPEELIQSIRDQLTLFTGILKNEGGHLHHIKAHGALYNDMTKDRQLTHNFILAIKPFLNGIKLYVPYGSVIADEASKNKINTVFEGFADRNYNKDLSLVSRALPNALITEPEMVLPHLVSMARKGVVKVVDENSVPIIAKTFCVHGDTPSALRILTYLAEALPGQHIFIEK